MIYYKSGLNTDFTQGISGDVEDINYRISKYGANSKEIIEPPGFFSLVWEASKDLTIRILIVAAFVSIGIKSNKILI